MKFTRLLILAVVAFSCGCGRDTDSAAVPTTDKVEGPNVKTLSHDQLMDVLHECHLHGSSDDSKVKYTIEYCSAAQSAHAMEGYTTSSPAVVDPTLTEMH